MEFLKVKINLTLLHLSLKGCTLKVFYLAFNFITYFNVSMVITFHEIYMRSYFNVLFLYYFNLYVLIWASI